MSSAPLRSILAEFGFNIDSTKLDHGHKKVEGFVGTLKRLGGIAAEAFIFHEVKEFVENIVHAGVELEHMSVKTGVSIEKLQELEYAARLSGVSAESLDGALAKLGKNLAKAKGAKIAGIDTKDVNGTRSAAEFLPDVAEKFESLTNTSDRAALAIKLFGKSGVALVPLLAKGREGIKELMEEAEALGGGFSEEGVHGAVAMEEGIVRLDFAMRGLKSNLAADVFPALADLVTGLAHLIRDFREWTKHTKVLQAAMTGFGVKGVLALIHHLGGLTSIFRTLFGVMMRTILPILLLEDFFVFMAGGKSVIGEVLEKAFGKGTGDKVRKTINDIIGGVERFTAKLGPVNALLGTLALLLGVKIVTGASAAAAAIPALVTQFAALAPPLIAAGAAAAALIALMDQLNKLNNETEGLGITGTIGEMIKQGTLDPFEAVDKYQNQKARERRRAADTNERHGLDENGNPTYGGGQARRGVTVDKKGRPVDEHGEVIRKGVTVDAKGRPVKATATAPVPAPVVQHVHNDSHPNINVTVPPGTDAQTARRVGDAAAQGSQRGFVLAATRAALVPQAG